MTEVKFYELGTIDDCLLTYAVVVSNYNGKWIYCKHKKRDTWEIPAGHIESGETPMEAARRELWEETGALEFDLEPICIYSITKYGLLCYATIKKIGELPDDSEIEKICFFDYEPKNLTYPLQSKLFDKARKSKCKILKKDWINMQNIKFLDGGVIAPQGFLAAGVHCGLRRNKEKKDLALIFSKGGRECTAAAVYTTNKVYGAPIAVTRENLKNGTAKAVICNSGIANTCNPDGIEKANLMCELTADMLGIDKSDIIVASTGVIGVSLPIAPIEAGLPMLKDSLADTKEAGEAAAIGIMTTDTRKKEYAVEFELDGKPARIGLIAKGSGMIEPNMATMLCFATTDVNISAAMLSEALIDAVGDTFNMVSVDGDTSTNDMVSIMASGLCGNAEITGKNQDYLTFRDALRTVCEKVSRLIAFDGEGATKLIECTVYNCASVQDARKLAKSVINSSLVKTMMFGADANCGRIMCALGYAGVDFDPFNADVKLKSAAGDMLFYENGMKLEFDEAEAKEMLSQEIIEILVDMKSGAGTEKATAWGCDLSYEYVRINGDYRS